MPHPRKGYYSASGERLVGTTTVIGRFKDSGALIRWAWKRGKEHPDEDLYATRDDAASAGTAAHAMVEARINGRDPMACDELLSLSPELQSKAVNAFGMYERWAEMSNLEIIEQEMQLVSERYGFGGTPDAIGKVDGKLCLVDWKTSNGVFSDYLLQLAAYRVLWEENHPDRPLSGGFHLCRFSKDYGDFAHHYYAELDSAREMFLHLLAAYGYDKELKARA